LDKTVQHPLYFIDLLIQLFMCFILFGISITSDKQLIFNLAIRFGSDALLTANR